MTDDLGERIWLPKGVQQPVPQTPASGRPSRRSRRRLLIVLLLVSVIGLSIGGGVLLGLRIVRLETRLSTAEQALEALDGSLTEGLGKVTVDLDSLSSELEAEGTQLTALGKETRDVELQVSKGEQSTESLQSNLSALRSIVFALQDSADQRFHDLGLCMYEEAKGHYYTFWYLTDTDGNRYMTNCD